MFQLTRNNAREYLTRHRIVAPEQQVEIDTRLSTPECLILSVSSAHSVIGNHFELKQIRPINRGGEVWVESLERFSNETAYLEYCQTNRCPVDGLRSPSVLFRDRVNHLYAATGGLSRRRWEPTLRFYLRKGDGDDRLATACGDFLARLHGTSWNDGRRVADLVDRRVFSYLCVEPCVRIARAAGTLEQFIENALEEMWNTRRSLVHGRFTSDTQGARRSAATLGFVL
jgi:hypothetical protein